MFITGLIIFFGIHLVPFFPITKTSLRTSFGENPYMGTFSLISLIGLIMIIFGYESRTDHLYPIYSFAYAYSGYVMFISLTFLVAAYLPTYLKNNKTSHVNWDWYLALLHLATNPDIISVILFGIFSLFNFRYFCF